MSATSELTFSRRIKSELALALYNEEEKRGILSGFTRYVGSVSLNNGKVLKMQSSIASVAKLIFSFFKEIYKVQPRFTYEKQLRLNKNIIYYIIVEDKVDEILRDLEILDSFERIKLHKMVNKEYFRGFLIGSFLASGQISDPSKGRYFCELCYNDETDARTVLGKFQLFKGNDEMNFKMTERRGKYIIYLKKGDQISVFISFLGAISMMLDFENERLTRDYFNNENRLTICAQANYGRMLKTGEKNLHDIEVIEKKIGSLYFDEKAKMLVALRKENKDSSYQELADMLLAKGIQITKSGVVHIFAKIAKDAQKLEE